MEPVSLSQRHGKDHKIDILTELTLKRRMNVVNFGSWSQGQKWHVEYPGFFTPKHSSPQAKGVRPFWTNDSIRRLGPIRFTRKRFLLLQQTFTDWPEVGPKIQYNFWLTKSLQCLRWMKIWPLRRCILPHKVVGGCEVWFVIQYALTFFLLLIWFLATWL